MMQLFSRCQTTNLLDAQISQSIKRHKKSVPFNSTIQSDTKDKKVRCTYTAALQTFPAQLLVFYKMNN